MTTRRRPHHGWTVPSGVAALALAGVACAVAVDTPPPADEADAAKAVLAQQSYLRVADESKGAVALEIAISRFEKPGAPSVSLVGVAHIADRGYYRRLQSILGEHDLVLYESVMPPGTGGAGGETDAEREASTRAALDFVGSVVETYRRERDAYPADLDALRTFADERDARLGDALAAALHDAWGRRVAYAPPAEGGRTFRLASLGADGAPGGDGADADLVLTDRPEPLPESAEDGIQAELASALGLAFQLEAMDYGAPRWIPSDMALDELQRALDARGADWEVLGGTLAGSSVPARIASLLLRTIRLADGFTDGAISDAMKVVLIEMLGDEEMIEIGMGQMGGAFAEVIINDRNQVVMDDLTALLQASDEPGAPQSIAIFYGAGHMDDLAKRLQDQLGYVPSGQEWETAIRVDLERSALDARTLRQMRLMMRAQMSRMRRMQ